MQKAVDSRRIRLKNFHNLGLKKFHNQGSRRFHNQSSKKFHSQSSKIFHSQGSKKRFKKVQKSFLINKHIYESIASTSHKKSETSLRPYINVVG